MPLVEGLREKERERERERERKREREVASVQMELNTLGKKK